MHMTSILPPLHVLMYFLDANGLKFKIQLMDI